MTPRAPTLGARLLARFLADNAFTYEIARAAIGAAHRSSVYQWATGHRVPRTAVAVAIERWTRGAVPVAAWSASDVSAVPTEAA